MRIAIIDLGTNSVRFDVYECEESKPPLRLHREKLMVRLGDDVYSSGKLNRAAMERTVEAFASFKHTAALLDVNRIIAVGTSALREAEDGEKFAAQVTKRTGIELLVISGDEEARLIALGVLNNEPLPESVFGLVDIGGGSTEISICKDKEIQLSRSIPAGAARLNQMFFSAGAPPTAAAIESLRSYVREKLVADFGDKPQRLREMLGSSGTIRALAKILKKNGVDRGRVEKDSLSRLVAQMSTMTAEQLLSIEGLEANRVDLILSGALLLDEIMAFFRTETVFISERSLRDGILHEELNHKPNGITPSTYRSATTRLKALNSNEAQFSAALQLLRTLLQELSETFKVSSRERYLLELALRLLYVSREMNSVNYSIHAEYLADHSHFFGLSRPERKTVADLCGKTHQSPSKIKVGKHVELATSAERFSNMLLLLQLADSVSFRKTRGIPRFRVKTTKNAVTLQLDGTGSYYLTLLQLEPIRIAFEQNFKLQLRISRKSTAPKQTRRAA